MTLRIAKLFATFFYLGYFPFAPGTVGTLGAIVLFYLLSGLSFTFYLLFLLIFIVFSIWVSDVSSKNSAESDPKYVVVDEVCGFLVSMMLIPANLMFIVLGFLIFRFFDVLKPPPLKNLERLPGGYGIVADDIAAGIYTNIVLHFVVWLL